MPLDAINLWFLTAELSDALTGGKIEKVQQPGKGTLLFSVRGEKTVKLLFTTSGGNSRFNLTKQEFENPKEPPMFCMLLRKYLTGARILSVTQEPEDRIIRIDMLAPGMFGEGEKRVVIAELMGRYGNLILTDGDGVITDCLFRTGSAEKARAVLPGLKYRPPKKPEMIPVTAGRETVSRLLRSGSQDIMTDKFLASAFFGVSSLIARELSWRAYGETSMPLFKAIEEDGGEKLADEISGLSELITKGGGKPYLIRRTDGTLLDFTYMPVFQYGPEHMITEESSFSELLELFYGERDEKERARQRTGELTKLISGKRDKLLRKTALQKEELIQAADREHLRENGDIIISNLHLMKKGMSVLKAYDFYSEDGGEREIKLDVRKTPQENAAKYYKDYTKAKNAEKHLTEQIAAGEREAEYLESVLEEIKRAESVNDVLQIKEELISSGYIREKKNGKKEKRPPAQKPMRFISSGGFEILAGRNNIQNDMLTLKTAGKNDIWFHTQKIHGSHVIIYCGGKIPDDKTLLEAASIAAYFSDGRSSGKVPVDYALVRHVKKPSGSRPGMVIYTDYKTIIAEPDEKLVEKLKVK